MNRRFNPLRAAAVDAEGRHLVRQRTGTLHTQTFERRDHGIAVGEIGTARVGAEFTMTREPHHDHRRENAEHELGDDHGDQVSRPVAALGLEHDAIDGMTDHA